MKNKKIKTQSEIYQEIRKVWDINPRTRVKPDKEIYNRGKEKQQFIKQLRENE